MYAKSIMQNARLNDLYDRVITETVDTVVAKQATQIVRGSGSLTPQLFIIGEAPGKKEDETGKPFVGASGKMLDQLLLSIDILRKDVYITNIVKFRPKDNRDPSSKEKQLFLPYLLEEINIINPPLIVTLGRHSMEQFLPSIKISDVHGQTHTVQIGSATRTLIPLYHPAAAMYNGALRKTLFEDMQAVRKAINS